MSPPLPTSAVWCYSGLLVILLSFSVETTLAKEDGIGDSLIQEEAVENWVNSMQLTGRHLPIWGGEMGLGVLLGNR